MFTANYTTEQCAGQASFTPSSLAHASQRPDMVWTFALCGMCLEGDQRELELWCSPVPVLLRAGGDVNKGGEGESFHQRLIYPQEGGKPKSRKHYSIVLWHWLTMCKITVLMINTVINIGRTWIQPLQRLLFKNNYKRNSNNIFLYHIFKVCYPAPLSRLPHGERNGS